MDVNSDIVLKTENISKSFYGIHALKSVGFELRHGEVHALLGENGAGKSTLLNILMGVFPPDEGVIYLNGVATVIKNPAQAKKIGINKVHQELQLVPELTVGENILLGHEPTLSFTGIINRRAIHRRAEEVLRMLNADFNSRAIVKRLSTAQMQIVEIAKALQWNSAVLALDEPTSSLTNVEIDRLFDIIRRLKAAGTSIIYVSHRLDEVFRIADRLTILRDGSCIGTYPVQGMTKPALIRLMVGRDIRDDMRSTQERTIGDPVLEVQNVRLSKQGPEINFCLRRGEILGFAGLVGSGRTELMRAIFGADPLRRGDILLNGKKVFIKSPADAIRHGIALIPEDRKLQGFVPILSNGSNINLPSFGKYLKSGLIDRRTLKGTTKQAMERLQINPADPEKLTRNLSGGNQQKVVLAKWLSRQAEIMIFDEPTRGIDVGAKSEIYKLMHELASQGKSIIMVSSELIEILGMSDRILVMGEGSIRGELLPAEATEEKILQIAMGGMEK